MAPGAKTYDEKVQGLRDLTIDTRLKRKRVEDAAVKAAEAKADAAEEEKQRKRARRNNKNPFSSGPMGAIGRTGVVGMGGGNVNVASPGPMKVHINPTPDAMLSISSPPDMDSIVIEANSTTIMEAWDTKAAMVDRPVGALGFADGIAYIMTRDGWINMGEALERPLEMTDRRGAIAAQKARRKE